MTHAHFAAIRALIPASVKSHLYDPNLSKPPTYSDFPYALLWGDMGDEVSGEPGDRTARDSVDQLELSVRVTLVALSGESMDWIVRNTRPFLNRARPAVVGWKSSRLRQAALVAPDRDERISIGSLHPIYAVDEYSFVSSAMTESTTPLGVIHG